MPNKLAWVTPENTPNRFICRRVFIPDDPLYMAAVNGALLMLTETYNWENVFGVPESEAAAAMQIMYDRYREGQFCMLGAIIPMAVENLPDHMIWCEGGIFERADYPQLYDVLSAELLISPTQFTVPDMRQRFPLGAADGLSVFDEGGESEVTLTTDGMPEHSHLTNPHNHASLPHSHTTLPHVHSEIGSVPSVGGEIPGAATLPSPSVTGPADVIVNPADVTIQTADVTVQNSGGGMPHNNMPPYVTMRYAMMAR